jgi:hypothetical protein
LWFEMPLFVDCVVVISMLVVVVIVVVCLWFFIPTPCLLIFCHYRNLPFIIRNFTFLACLLLTPCQVASGSLASWSHCLRRTSGDHSHDLHHYRYVVESCAAVPAAVAAVAVAAVRAVFCSLRVREPGRYQDLYLCLR